MVTVFAEMIKVTCQSTLREGEYAGGPDPVTGAPMHVWRPGTEKADRLEVREPSLAESQQDMGTSVLLLPGEEL